MSKPFCVSIIICTCNRAEHLQRTLDSMAQICVPGALTTELIVVDNASTDNTEAMVKVCHLRDIQIFLNIPHALRIFAEGTPTETGRTLEYNGGAG